MGTVFTGRPDGDDQVQPARIIVDQARHPIMGGVTLPWTPSDEWYSFTNDPATRGMTVLARIDEASYRSGEKLKMGQHPIMWINPQTKGRVFFSALGYDASAYDDHNYRRVLTSAIRWAAR